MSLGDTEKNLQAALSKLSNLSMKGLGIARDSIVQSSHTVKLKLDITSLERDKKRLISDLGNDVFEAIKDGRLKTKLFTDLFESIKGIEEKISAKETELEKSGEVSPLKEEAKAEEESKPKSKENDTKEAEKKPEEEKD